MKKIMLLFGLAVIGSGMVFANDGNVSWDDIKLLNGAYVEYEPNATVSAIDADKKIEEQDFIDAFNKFVSHYNAEVADSGATPLADPTDKTELTGKTREAGITHITGLTGKTGTTGVKGNVAYRYESEKAKYLCSTIYSDLKTIGKLLFEEKGLATKSVFSNKSEFLFYFHVNDRVIRRIISALAANTLKFCYLTLPCQERTEDLLGILGVLGVLGSVPEVSLNMSEIIRAKETLEETFDELADLFRDVESVCAFITTADCKARSNDAILSFMRHQIRRDMFSAIDAFAEAYEVFVAVVQNSFADTKG